MWDIDHAHCTPAWRGVTCMHLQTISNILLAMLTCCVRASPCAIAHATHLVDVVLRGAEEAHLKGHSADSDRSRTQYRPARGCVSGPTVPRPCYMRPPHHHHTHTHTHTHTARVHSRSPASIPSALHSLPSPSPCSTMLGLQDMI